MARLMAVISSLLLAGHTEPARQRCRWDELYSLDCSLSGMTTLPNSPAQTFLMLSGKQPGTVDHLKSIKHINLSSNRISTLHLEIFANFSALETINLKNNRIYSISLSMNRWSKIQGVKSVSDQSLTSLNALMLETNWLNSVPKGLGKLQSLQNVLLSHNRILHINQDDFSNCTKLERIDLQHNRISKIHPNAFKDTKNLKVLTLSRNALTTIAPVVFMYTHVLQAEIDLSNNPWACDCRIHDLKYFISFLSNELEKELNITCASPSHIAGTDLLSTGDFLSICETPLESSFLFKKVIFPSGIKSVLHCDLPDDLGSQSTFWWTPQGAVFENQPLTYYYLDAMKHLVITAPDSSAEGLYICVSYAMRIVYQVNVQRDYSSVLNSHPRHIRAVRATVRTQEDFTLAVCLSVFITFICAFCLGVFTRPFFDKLWRTWCKSKPGTEQHLQSNTYENSGFTNETLAEGVTTGKTVNNLKHVHFPQGVYQHALPSVNNTGVPDDDSVQYDDVTDCQIEIHRIHSPTMGNSEPRNLETSTVVQQSIMPTPAFRTKYIMSTEGKMQPNSKKAQRPEKDKARKIKPVGAIETDGVVNQKVHPERFASYDVSNTSISNSECSDNTKVTGVITAEVIKSPKQNQLFPHSISQSPPQVKETTVNIGITGPFPHESEDNVRRSRNTASVQIGHGLDNRKSNQDIFSAKYAYHNDESLSDDGSFFSFNLSNSDASEEMEIHSSDDDEVINHIINDVILQSSANPEEVDGTSPHDLNKPSLLRKDTFTLIKLPDQDEDICAIDHQCMKDINVNSQKGTDNTYSKDNLQIYASDSSDENDEQLNDDLQHKHNKQEMLQTNYFQDPDGPVRTANNNLIFTKESHTPASIPQSSYRRHGGQNNKSPVFCRFDRKYYGFKVTVIPGMMKSPQHHQIVSNNIICYNEASGDNTDNDSDSHKDNMMDTSQRYHYQISNVASANEVSSDSSDDASDSEKLDLVAISQQQHIMTGNTNFPNNELEDTADSDSDSVKTNEVDDSLSTILSHYTTHKDQRDNDQVFCRFDRRYCGFNVTVLPGVVHTPQYHHILAKNITCVNKEDGDDLIGFHPYAEPTLQHSLILTGNAAHSKRVSEDSTDDSSDSYEDEVDMVATPKQQLTRTEDITSICKESEYSPDYDLNTYNYNNAHLYLSINQSNYATHEDQNNTSPVFCRFDRSYRGFNVKVIPGLEHKQHPHQILAENITLVNSQHSGAIEDGSDPCIEQTPQQHLILTRDTDQANEASEDSTDDSSDSSDDEVGMGAAPQQEHIMTKEITCLNEDSEDSDSDSVKPNEVNHSLPTLQSYYKTHQDQRDDDQVFCKFDRRYCGFKVTVLPGVVHTPQYPPILTESITCVNQENGEAIEDSSHPFREPTLQQHLFLTKDTAQANEDSDDSTDDSSDSSDDEVGMVAAPQQQPIMTKEITLLNKVPEDTVDSDSDSVNANEVHHSLSALQSYYTACKGQRDDTQVFCRFDRRYCGFKVTVLPRVVNMPQYPPIQTESISCVNKEHGESIEDSSDPFIESTPQQHLILTRDTTKANKASDDSTDDSADSSNDEVEQVSAPNQQCIIKEDITCFNEGSEDTAGSELDAYNANNAQLPLSISQLNYITHEDQSKPSPVFCRFDRSYRGFKVKVIPGLEHQPHPHLILTENIIRVHEEYEAAVENGSDSYADAMVHTPQSPEILSGNTACAKEASDDSSDDSSDSYENDMVNTPQHHQVLNKNIYWVNKDSIDSTEAVSNSSSADEDHISLSTLPSTYTPHDNYGKENQVFCRFDRQYCGFQVTVLPGVVHTPQYYNILSENMTVVNSEHSGAIEDGSDPFTESTPQQHLILTRDTAQANEDSDDFTDDSSDPYENDMVNTPQHHQVLNKNIYWVNKNSIDSTEAVSNSSSANEDHISLSTLPSTYTQHENYGKENQVFCRFDRQYCGFQVTVLPGVVHTPQYYNILSENMTVVNSEHSGAIEDGSEPFTESTPQQHLILTRDTAQANEDSDDSTDDSSDSFDDEVGMGAAPQQEPFMTEDITYLNEGPEDRADSDSDSVMANEVHHSLSALQSYYTAHKDQRDENQFFCRFDRRYYGFKVTVLPSVVHTPQYPPILPKNITCVDIEYGDAIEDNYDPLIESSPQQHLILTGNMVDVNEASDDSTDDASDSYDANEELLSSNMQSNYTTHEDTIFCRFDRQYHGFNVTVIDVMNGQKTAKIAKNITLVNRSDNTDKDAPENRYDVSHNEPLSLFSESSDRLTLQIPDFGETDTEATSINLDIYSSSTDVGGAGTGDKGTSDNRGGIFVKRKRVFDAFSASLKSGQY